MVFASMRTLPFQIRVARKALAFLVIPGFSTFASWEYRARIKSVSAEMSSGLSFRGGKKIETILRR